MKMPLKQIGFYATMLLFVFSFSSCLNNKNITYFPTLRDSTFVINNVDFTPKIQKGDIIMVIVNSADPESDLIFNNINNVTVPGVQGNPNMAATPGLLVERDGKITLPKVGSVYALGKTKAELEKELQVLLLPYLKEPVINIRFMNYRVTVLGEVSKPGTYTSGNERMTILEALGASGDITQFGNRTNILVIRDSSSVAVAHRINILDNSLFRSEYYYLQTNDVLYVEPRNQKAYSSSQAVILIPIISSVLTSLLLVYNLFK